VALPLLLAALLQDAPLREIAEAAARGDFARSETLSLRLLERDPGSARAWFYLGHARAATGRFAEAVEPYQKALALGLDDPKVRHQLGTSAHRAGRHDVAVPALEAALRASPDLADARYALGVSLLELQRAAEAERTLAPLAEGGGIWSFHRGLARRRLGREAEAVDDLRRVAETAEAPELRARARDLLAPDVQDVEPSAPRLSGLVLMKAGYDSNVLLLPETSVSRGSEEDSAFLFSFASADADLTGDDVLRFRASALDVRYDDVRRADLSGLLGEVEGRHTWAEAGTGRLALHGDLFHLDHDPLYRRAGVSAAFRRDWIPELGTEVGGLWSVRDYRPSDFEPLDGRDLGAHLEAIWAGVPDLLDARLAYRFLDENADRDDLDARVHRLELKGTIRLRTDVDLRLDGWLAKADYGAPDPATLETRHDRRRGGRATASWMATPAFQVFVEVEAERSNSSISDFDYSRVAGSAGAAFYF
jgi:tetratricopeptide (TPR) repeat protein